MNAIKVQVSIESALSSHEAFRRMGYPPADIFVTMHPLEGVGIVPWVVLRSPLLRESVRIALSYEPFSIAEEQEFLELWPKAAVAWNETMTPDERMKLWRSSYVANHTADFVMMMMSHGHTDTNPGKALA